MRGDMIRPKEGETEFTVMNHYDESKRVSTRTHRYFYGPIEDTPLRWLLCSRRNTVATSLSPSRRSGIPVTMVRIPLYIPSDVRSNYPDFQLPNTSRETTGAYTRIGCTASTIA